MPARYYYSQLLHAGLAGAALLLSPAALAVERTYDVDFSLTDVPIYDPGASGPIFKAVLAEAPIGPQLNLGAITNVPLFGDFGLAANFFAGVKIGLETKVTDFQIGTAMVDYPIRVKLDTPSSIAPGKEFTIGSSFEILPGANFLTMANQATVEIGAKVALAAELSVKACAFGCFLDEKPIDVNVNLGTIPLIKQTVESTEVQINIPGYGKPTFAGPGLDIDPDNTDDDRPLTDPDFLLDLALSTATNIDGMIRAPSVEVEGKLEGNTLIGTKRDVFTDIDVNLTGYIPGAALLNFGPIDIGGGLQLGYDLFSGVLSTQLIGEQQIEFSGTPMITLDLGPELGTHTFAAGESLTLMAPEELGALVFDPEITLESMLTTNLALAATQDFTITIGELFIKFPKIEVVKATAPVIVDPPRFCLIPGFKGCIKYVDPKPFTLVPGTNGISVPGFTFDEHILKYSFKDEALTSGFGETPSVNAASSESFGIGGVEKSETYLNSQSVTFASMNLGATRIQVPVPAGLAFLLMPAALMIVRRRRS